MITSTRRGDVIELCLGAEPCNEIGLDMLAALEEAIAGIPADARAVILWSGVRRGFSAGADLRALYHGILATPQAERNREITRFIDRIHAVMDALDMLPQTTIGVIHGVCFGGGFELALTCDLRIAERSARFAFPELRLGLVPGFGGIPRLKRDVGNAVVRDLLLTGRSINARKAVEIGLASQMVGPGEGLEAARRVADQAARYEPDTRATAKAFVKRLPVAELHEEKAHFLRLVQRPNVIESLRNFVEDAGPMPYLSTPGT